MKIKFTLNGKPSSFEAEPGRPPEAAEGAPGVEAPESGCREPGEDGGGEDEEREQDEVVHERSLVVDSRRELGSRADVQFAVDPRQRRLDGVDGDEELRGDLLVRPSARNQCCNAML